MSAFDAVVVSRDEEKRQSVALARLTEADLMEGDVTVRVTHSTVNYKDGLAVTGKLPVVRRWPMVPGVDFTGEVISSSDPYFAPGDAVILNGWGVGEAHLGGWAGIARVKGDWLIRRPAGLTGAEAMAIGTAGYTAMLSLMALEAHGLTPASGPAVVTGAAGGVGSVAVMLLAAAGWHVAAVTGRPSEADYLTGLGAAEIVDRAELSGPAKPLARERWAAGVDNVGSHILANVLSMIKAEGAVAACGNAMGMDLPTSVAPFILRGVSLLGINSVSVPRAKRETAWTRLATGLDRTKLAAMTTTIPLSGAIDAGRAIAEGKVRGRTVVEIG
ncbi:MDR family oxidoreductase [Oharaeibacter diazotrophicus]|uniref:Acrylyl-CoA reductase (NADPH) n=1 Tax=Oharaeibacter diazotrophicus TaxID=1920512 RepID=A0A4R6RM18_9HYPH|nr:MDR family oxidoreductase [Oharaeibacter diazotrophicus]TDP87037.1 acrylyl-CoA reductase (NADPH) [Oharaeibacter diazotrophicus]BBE71020.1 acrylyl-CoA reductase AcuI [Pleomorphomonas sp. SM30]GLS77770.1 alcohol dehydrogenase [Oharaeibacter diazotrophicus]